MKEWRRIITLAGLSLIGGAVVTTLIAEGIGVSGVVHADPAAPVRVVRVADRYVVAYDTCGLGWRILHWFTADQRSAATFQYAYDNHLIFYDTPADSAYLHCDLPGSLPRWSRLWRVEASPFDAGMPSDFFAEEAWEVGIGWPLAASSIEIHDGYAWSYEGGRPVGSPSANGLKYLLWRPIPTGFAADTLIWGAALVGVVWGTRLVRRRLRQRRGACGGCGYDLSGLSHGGVCPECGAGMSAAPVAALPSERSKP